jgi:integrase
LSYKALLGRLKKIGIMAGVGRFHPYRARHSFGSILYDNTKDINYVAQQMGHRSIETTRRYLHTSESQKSKYMEGFRKRIEEAEKGREYPMSDNGDTSYGGNGS